MQGIDAVPAFSAVQEHNKSEVRRLLEQIRDEQVSAKRGLSDFAYGTAQHQFITQKMDNMGKLQEKLEVLVGKGNTVPLIIETLNTVPDVKPSAQQPS